MTMRNAVLVTQIPAILLSASLISLPCRAAPGKKEDPSALRESAAASLEVGEPEAALEKLLRAYELAPAKNTDLKLQIAVDIARARVEVYRVTEDASQLTRAESLLETQLDALPSDDLRRAGVESVLRDVRDASESTGESAEGASGGDTAGGSSEGEAEGPGSGAEGGEAGSGEEHVTTGAGGGFTDEEIGRSATLIETNKPLPECGPDRPQDRCRALVDVTTTEMLQGTKKAKITYAVLAGAGIGVVTPPGVWLLVTGLRLNKLEKQCEDAGLSDCGNGAEPRIIAGATLTAFGVILSFAGLAMLMKTARIGRQATQLRKDHQLTFSPTFDRSMGGLSLGGRF